MSPPKLAILIPTIEGREPFFDALWNELTRQRAALATPDDVILLVNKDDQTRTIGQKRNELMDAAVDSGATHRAFIDDDDRVSADYLALNLPGVHGDFDCNSLWGRYYLHGVYDRPFHHSLRYTHWWQDAAGYYRNPNHLNVTRIAAIKHLRFRAQSSGEDHGFSMDLSRDNALKTEYAITETLYHYYDRAKPQQEIDGLSRQRPPSP